MSDFSIALSPLLPVWLLATLSLGAVLVIGLGLWTRRRGTWLRFLGFALILLALFDPALVREERQPLKDVVAVVLDRSGSQSIGERTDQTDQARAALEKSLALLGNIETRIFDAGQTNADSDGTKLFAALREGLADVPAERVGGVIVVTDGIVHDIPSSADALGFKAPVHALITGHAGERDRRIELVEAPRFGIVGKDLTVSLRVLDSDDHGEPVNLVVRRDGVDIAKFDGRPGQIIKVPVRIAHGGANVIEFEVPVLPGELTAINNKAVAIIEGVRDKLKVLLVSGEPHAGERTWRNLLKSDPNVDLVHFTILRPPEKQDGTPINELSLIAFPTADLFGRKINDFDLIVFDRYSNQTILPPIYFQNIVNYVRDGGALLLAAGPDFSGPDGLFFSPLGQISPVRPNGQLIERAFRATVSDDGRKHPVTRGLQGADQTPPAWSDWFRQISGDTIRGTPVLTGADKRPLLVLSREGKGRVSLLLSDQMWLWARGFDGGGPHIDLLRRLGHWLMKEPELEEEALRASVRGKSLTLQRQTLKATAKPVTITAPSGKTQTLDLAAGAPGLWSGHIEASELGLYRVDDGELSALANVGPENPREYQEVVSTTEQLRPLVETTGGTVRRLASSAVENAITLPRLVAMGDSPVYGGGDYIGIHRTGASIVTGVGVAPLAIGFAGVAALLGSVVAGWLAEARRRRRSAPTT